ncbi:HdeD family acid-resistance protein [Carnobacterium gallinarum]|uniref:HdeD family acid-resistance protein n=1 Tax=Carnobacterium gallinarum TaxID=2749 RepID=UPI00055263F2|nr:DUF308 domain-containing protein [Carnobacterium gallinarum]
MTQRKTDWGSLILGVLFIITALFSFQDPIGNLATIVIIFALMAILKGLFELFFRNKLKELTGIKAYVPIVTAVANIVIGAYLLFNLDIGITILPYVFATWFLIDSILGLFTLDLAKNVSTGHLWFTVIVTILGIILGLMLLFNPISSALTLSFLVGFYFMVFGINQIVYAFR